jgi:hypothetical protein
VSKYDPGTPACAKQCRYNISTLLSRDETYLFLRVKNKMLNEWRVNPGESDKVVDISRQSTMIYTDQRNFVGHSLSRGQGEVHLLPDWSLGVR